MTALDHATIKQGDGMVTVTVTGDLDLSTKADLRKQLADILAGPYPGQIFLDLRGLAFIDAGGLGTLIAIQNLAERQGVRLLLAGAPSHLLRLIAITRLENHFTLVPARDG